MVGDAEPGTLGVDLVALLIGGVVCAALAAGLAVVFFHAFGSSSGTGATAASLGDAYNTFLGAALGVLAGSLLAAALAHHGSPVLSGTLAGFLAYAIVLAPLLVLTRPGDTSAGEMIGFAVLLALPVAVIALTGAALGSLLASVRR